MNRNAALVQVTDFADRLGAIGAYLEAANLRANRQVRILAGIFEVTCAHSFPIEWSAVAANPRPGVRSRAEGAGSRVDNFDAWLRTVGEIGGIRHIASCTSTRERSIALQHYRSFSSMRIAGTPDAFRKCAPGSGNCRDEQVATHIESHERPEIVASRELAVGWKRAGWRAYDSPI